MKEQHLVAAEPNAYFTTTKVLHVLDNSYQSYGWMCIQEGSQVKGRFCGTSVSGMPKRQICNNASVTSAAHLGNFLKA